MRGREKSEKAQVWPDLSATGGAGAGSDRGGGWVRRWAGEFESRAGLGSKGRQGANRTGGFGINQFPIRNVIGSAIESDMSPN